MAPSKQLWTADMYRSLRRASKTLFVAFLFLGIGSFLSMTNDENILGLFGMISSLIAMIGLSTMMGVFRDLVAASEGGVPKENVHEPVSLKAPAPQAVMRTISTPGSAESYWEAQAKTGAQRRTASVAPTHTAPAIKIDWEEWLGKKLLQKAGILIVLIGMLVFLKYSFDNGWVDELGRVIASCFAAIGLLVAGEVFHKKYNAWSQAFTGGGLVLLYITVWVAHVLYAAPLAAKYGIVLPVGFAFVLYSFITLIGALAAVRYNAQTIAWFTVLGGYLTPHLVNAPTVDHTALLLYLAVLAGGMMLLAWHRKWRHVNAAAFILTNLYLFTEVYTAVPEFGDGAQVITASGFFLLFNILPLLYQFRQKLRADVQDIGIIIFNGLAVFLPVVDALGGWDSGYVGIVCLILAAFYLGFSAISLKGRSEDNQLVNTYLVGTVVLVAGALLAELESEWVSAGWAPLSLLLVFISTRLQRMGPWVCAVILMIGSLFFLGINMPIVTAGMEEIWHPFMSNWAIQSYVVFASVIGWIVLSKKLPQTLIAQENIGTLQNLLHGALAVILFLAVTFEATRLDFHIDIVWTFAYIALGVIAIGIFFFTENSIWFITAFLVQIFALLFIFLFGENSGMGIFVEDSVRPLVHPWSYLSIIALLATFVIAYVSKLKKDRFITGLPADKLMIVVALSQVWVHVSVEINNLSQAYDWTSLVYERVLSGWWIVFALVMLAYGILKNRSNIAVAGGALLAIPFAYTHLHIIAGGERMAETMVWTALALGVSVTGIRSKNPTIVFMGMLYLGLAAGIDMISHMGGSGAGLLRSSWWALAGLASMVVGFMEREKKLRQLAMIIFGATALKLLIVDFSNLETPVRIGASIATGLLMIGASYLYQRFDALLGTVPSAAKKI